MVKKALKQWSGGFLYTKYDNTFYSLDVCFALELCIVSKKMNFKEDLGWVTKRFFDGEFIMVESIFAKIVNFDSDEDLEKYCQLFLVW